MFSVAAILKGQCGIDADLFHLPDNETAIFEGLEAILAEYELVILSGAVSEGKFDFVPKVLADLDVEKLFHKVAQRPGKPFWFGRRDDVVIFALPGNPVSSFMCACRYVVPYVDQQLCDSLELPERWATLTADVIFKPDLTYFLPVKVSYTEGYILATPVEGHGSGDLANLNDADGFLELPSARTVFKEKEVFPLYLYR